MAIVGEAAFSEEEKDQIRYLLGYPNADPVAMQQLGVPASSQPMFLVNIAMERMRVTSAGRVRQHMSILEGIEKRLVDCQSRFEAKSVGEITLNPDEPDMLEKEYDRWGNRLANLLGVPYYPYAKRFQQGPPPLVQSRASC